MGRNQNFVRVALTAVALVYLSACWGNDQEADTNSNLDE